VAPGNLPFGERRPYHFVRFTLKASDVTHDEAAALLTTIFTDVLDDDHIVLEDETTANDIEGWDSLSHIRLIVAIEKKFRIRFSASEVSSLRNVGEMLDLIIRKSAAA
jgi:acyl carrier protein